MNTRTTHTWQGPCKCLSFRRHLTHQRITSSLRRNAIYFAMLRLWPHHILCLSDGARQRRTRAYDQRFESEPTISTEQLPLRRRCVNHPCHHCIQSPLHPHAYGTAAMLHCAVLHLPAPGVRNCGRWHYGHTPTCYSGKQGNHEESVLPPSDERSASDVLSQHQAVSLPLTSLSSAGIVTEQLAREAATLARSAALGGSVAALHRCARVRNQPVNACDHKFTIRSRHVQRAGAGVPVPCPELQGATLGPPCRSYLMLESSS